MRQSELGIPIGLVVLHGEDAQIIEQDQGLNYLKSSHPSDSTAVHAVNLLVRHGRVLIESSGDHFTSKPHPLQVAIWAVPQDNWPFMIASKEVRTAYFHMLAHLRVIPPSLNHQQQQEQTQTSYANAQAFNGSYTQLLQNEAATRLLDIYLQLPSPSVDLAITLDDDRPTGLFGETTSQLLGACVEMASPKGMKTELYGYQRRSLYKMVQRELIPRKMCDPAFVPLQDRDGQPYIFNTLPNALGLYRQPPFEWDDVRGGILCEDMGTGKTCICIALILHTRHQISLPSTAPRTSVLCDVYPTMEPSVVDLESPQLFLSRVIPAKYGVPSLMDMAITAIKVHGIHYSEDMVGPFLVEKLNKYPAYTLEPLLRVTQGVARNGPRPGPGTRKKRKQQEREEVVKVYLSSSTLVIVPANLVDQWCFELNKHTHEHALEVLVIPETSNSPIPPAETLIQHDIILISQSRFSREYDSGAFAKILSANRKCTCDSIATFTRCRCPTEHTISPLQHVRWKRIIVDEGHSMGSQSSNYALLASSMFAERRWICTGTPTQNLSNLADYYQPMDTGNYGHTNEAGHSGHRAPEEQRPTPARRVTVSDQEDLVKLSTIVANYLQLEPFASGPKLFSKELQTPFLLTKGSGDRVDSLMRRMAAVKLRRLMETLMVRNQPEDIMKDISLPPLREKVVHLPFGYFQTLTHNCQVGLIHANAVLSEREGVDYFFHPKNTKFLRQVIGNLQQSCFWFSGGGEEARPSPSSGSKNGEGGAGEAGKATGGALGSTNSTAPKVTSFFHQVQEALRNVKKGLKKDQESRETLGAGVFPLEDVELLQQIRANFELALQDKSWTHMVQLDHMAYYCRNLPKILQPIQHQHPEEPPSSSPSGSCLSSPPSSPSSIPVANAHPKQAWQSVLSEEDLDGSGVLVQLCRINADALEQAQASSHRDQNHLLSAIEAHLCVVDAAQVEQAREVIAKADTASFSSLGRKEESLSSLLRAHFLKGQREKAGLDNVSLPMAEQAEEAGGADTLLQDLSAALTRERLSQAKILASASSKLNYIVSRILLVHRDEKTIVFCDHPNAVHDLYHYLVMAKVRCLLYLRHMSQSQRSKNITTFNTSENVSVFIMDTRAGAAYGIDLSAASRIYFVSPPFHTALERQAIKRAHRIGQQRPVFVETLVIQDSFEEAVLERRREEDDFGNGNGGGGINGKGDGGASSSSGAFRQQSQQSFGRTIEKDGKMRETISRVRFIPLSDAARVIRPLSYYASIGPNRFPEEGQAIIADPEIPVVLPRTDKQMEAHRLAEQADHRVRIEDEEEEEDGDERKRQEASTKEKKSDSGWTTAAVHVHRTETHGKRRRVTFALDESEAMQVSLASSSDLEMDPGPGAFKRKSRGEDDEDEGGERSQWS